MTDAMTILVIDDSEDDRLLYRRALNKSMGKSWRIIEAADGEEGLECCIHGEPPSCVLLDYSMPGHNGVEILKRIRQAHAFVPVVMLTGLGNEAVAVTAIQEGAQNYIAKATITPETLEHVVRSAIEHCTMQKRLGEQRESLNIFTRALAHDLKEPVRTILSFLELIAGQQTFEEKSQAYFHYIESAARRMDMLIESVYFYTRLDGGEQIAKEVCSVATVLEETKSNLSRLLKERNARVVHDALPDIYANRTQLTQALQNLIANAVNHSETPVSIQVHAKEEPGQWHFEVTDNGPGIEKTSLERIFQPFKRLSRKDVPGSGLGLAICRKIVESHGGKIWCESEPGKGAAFHFILPKAVPDATSAPFASDTLSPGLAATVAAVAKEDAQVLASVLLVDDNEADIELARIMLFEHMHLHCNLYVAHDGREALDWLHKARRENKPIDLMLLDINMPGMDGFELLEVMRRQEKINDVDVVMYSTSKYDKDIGRAQELGVAGYLSKPADVPKLKLLIENNSHLRLCEEGDGYKLLRAA